MSLRGGALGGKGKSLAGFTNTYVYDVAINNQLIIDKDHDGQFFTIYEDSTATPEELVFEYDGATIMTLSEDGIVALGTIGGSGDLTIEGTGTNNDMFLGNISGGSSTTGLQHNDLAKDGTNFALRQVSAGQTMINSANSLDLILGTDSVSRFIVRNNGDVDLQNTAQWYQSGGNNILSLTTLGTTVINSSLQNLGVQDANLDMGTNNITNATSITGTNLTGTLQTASQPNITSLGTLTDLVVADTNIGAEVDVKITNLDTTNALSNATLLIETVGASAGNPAIKWNIAGASNFVMGIDNIGGGSPFKISAGATLGTNDRLIIDSSGNINNVSGEYQIGGTSVLSSTDLGVGVVNSSLTNVGTLTSLTMGGTLAMGVNNITGTGTISATSFSGTNLTGTLQTASQPNITSVGTLTSLSMGGQITIGNSGSLSLGTLAGTGGMYYYDGTDTNWGMYFRSVGVGLSWSGGTTVGYNGMNATGFQLRNRVVNADVSGFIWENSAETPLMGLTGSSGNLQIAGNMNTADYQIGGTSVLNSTTLGAGILNSSIDTNNGDLVNTGDLVVNGGGVNTELLVGDMGFNSFAGIRHNRLTGINNFALIHSEAGDLRLNFSLGMELTIHENNSTLITTFNSGGLTLGSTKSYKIGTTEVLTEDTLGGTILNSSIDTNTGDLTNTGQLIVQGNGTNTDMLLGNVIGTNLTGWRHNDLTLNSDYAMIQAKTGATFVNASTGQNINIHLGNVTQAIWSSTGLTLSAGKLLSTSATGGTQIQLTSTDATSHTTIGLNTNGNDWLFGARGSTAVNANTFYIYDNTASSFRMLIDSNGDIEIPGGSILATASNFVRTSNQTLTTATDTIITYTGTDYNRGASITESSGSIDLGKGGLFMVTYQVRFANNGDGDRWTYIEQGTSGFGSVLASLKLDSSNTDVQEHSSSCVISASATGASQLIRLRVEQTSGVNVNVTSAYLQITQLATETQ